MSYTSFKHGYAVESTYGSTAIADTNATAYLLGILSQQSKWPNPTWQALYRATGVGAYEVDSGALWKIAQARTGYFGLALQNAIPIWLVMGNSSTTGTGPYTHTISAGDLPSITLQHERFGSGDDWAIQYRGVMCANLALECGQEIFFLRADLDWVAQDAVDPGFTLTNDPNLPPTANTDPYLFSQLTRTWDYGGANLALDGLTHVRVNISPGLQPLLAHYWDSGVDKSHIPRGYFEAPRRQYTIEFTYHPENDDVWDELISTSNTKDLLLKWTRSTDDYIQLVASDCLVVEHETLTPPVGEALLEKVVLEPRSLTFTVSDQIAGGHYGE